MPLSQASPARASSEGYLGTTVAGTVGTTTVPGRGSGLPLHLDSPEARVRGVAFGVLARWKHQRGLEVRRPFQSGVIVWSPPSE